jgi:hypothetical protein
MMEDGVGRRDAMAWDRGRVGLTAGGKRSEA